MNIHSVAKILYGFWGVVFLFAGTFVVLFNTGMLPQTIESIILKEADHNVNALHNLQEFGSLLVFAGLISIWFMRHYEQSIGFHWAMTIFWALIAAVHWADVRGLRASLAGPVINTIPVLMFAVVGVLRIRRIS